MILKNMSRKCLAFDLETAKVPPISEGNWKSYRPLGISCAATLLSDRGDPLLWHGGVNRSRPARQMNRHEVMRLVNYLERQVTRGYTIVSWNGVGFDFDVLAEESEMVQKCINLAGHHVDMMFHVLCQLGYAISLDSAARGMGLAGKKGGMTGAQIPRLWLDGRREEVLEYVPHDVRITLELAQTCESRGYIRWITRSGRRRELLLPKGWLPVSSAARLPEPNTLWMRSQWSRKRFTAWLRFDGRSRPFCR